MGKTSEKIVSIPGLWEVSLIATERIDAATPRRQAIFLSFAIPYPANSIAMPIKAKTLPLPILNTPSI